MKINSPFMFFATASMVVACCFALVWAVSNPELRTDIKTGNAHRECAQLNCGSELSFKIDDPDSGDFDSGDGNVFGLEVSNNGTTAAWQSEFPVCAILVKSGNAYHVYYPSGGTSGTVIGTPGPQGQARGISHITFCYDYPPATFVDDTAWSFGPRYVQQGNWATYTPYDGMEDTVEIFAGQTKLAGYATFSDVIDGKVTISIMLVNGFFFYQEDENAPEENLHVQHYFQAPSGNPAPGQFDWKQTLSHGTTHTTIEVPAAPFYGVHLVVAGPATP